MRLPELQRNWDRWGRTDPLYAISTAPQYRGGKWDDASFFATGEENVASLMETLARIVPDLEKGDALDFGCGVGRLTLPLAERFERVVGVDIAPSMIEHAEHYNRRPDRIRYVLNNNSHLRVFPDESFDLVYSDITLLHVEPRYSLAYVREFLRIVRPNGAVVFQLPSPTRRQKTRDRIPRVLVDVGNWLLTIRRPKMEVYGVEPETVRSTVENMGAEVIELRSEPGRTYSSADNRYFITRSCSGRSRTASSGPE